MSNGQAPTVHCRVQARSGQVARCRRTPGVEVAIDLGIRRNQLYKWKAEQVRSGELSFPGSGRKHADQDSEIVRLKRELARMTEERDILKKRRRENGIEARRRRRFKVTHYARRHKNTAPDLPRRKFQAERPNQCWVGDVTFISTRQGWLYLAVLIDLYSRRVVGWGLPDRNDEPLVSAALRMAITHRQPAAGLIHHMDRSVLYSSGNYRRLMAAAGLLPSMSRHGDCYDKACAESFFSSLKNEFVHGEVFATRDAARVAIVSYIEGFYYRKRLHQTTGYRIPAVVDDEAMSA